MMYRSSRTGLDQNKNVYYDEFYGTSSKKRECESCDKKTNRKSSNGLQKCSIVNVGTLNKSVSVDYYID